MPMKFSCILQRPLCCCIPVTYLSYQVHMSFTCSTQNLPSKMGKLYVSQKNPFTTIQCKIFLNRPGGSYINCHFWDKIIQNVNSSFRPFKTEVYTNSIGSQTLNLIHFIGQFHRKKGKASVCFKTTLTTKSKFTQIPKSLTRNRNELL